MICVVFECGFEESIEMMVFVIGGEIRVFRISRVGLKSVRLIELGIEYWKSLRFKVR